jgi:hypothetical protein
VRFANGDALLNIRWIEARDSGDLKVTTIVFNLSTFNSQIRSQPIKDARQAEIAEGKKFLLHEDDADSSSAIKKSQLAPNLGNACKRFSQDQ